MNVEKMCIFLNKQKFLEYVFDMIESHFGHSCSEEAFGFGSFGDRSYLQAYMYFQAVRQRFTGTGGLLSSASLQRFDRHLEEQ